MKYFIRTFLAIDGNYTEWTKWSNCSATCGGGSQTRARNCSNPPPQKGGKGCEELGPANQTQECNTDPCRKLKEVLNRVIKSENLRNIVVV